MGVEIHGFCDDRFRPLEDAFRANFDDGPELGASLGVTWRGETVVDLWAGWADAEQTRPWREDTIVTVASTTKIMLAICGLMLVDRGRLDLDAPMARYWPEFAQGGKAAVTVRDAFSHQAGVPAWDPPVSFEAVEDWDSIIARTSAEPHWFGGERRVAYHGFTYGFVLGELIRRADGRRPAQFFREEVATPAGADFHMGLSDRSDIPRLAQVVRPDRPAPAEPGSVLARMLAAGQALLDGDWMSWGRLSADFAAANGYGNGRSIARLCAILAMGGELDGVRYMSRRMVEEAATEQAYGVCPYLGPVRFGLGFGLDSAEYKAPTPTSFHWGGTGGSWGLMDPRAQVSLGYAPNNWRVETHGAAIDPRQSRFARALHKLLPQL